MRTVFESKVACDDGLVEVDGHHTKSASFVMLTIRNHEGVTTMTLEAAKKLARALEDAAYEVQAAQEERSDG